MKTQFAMLCSILFLVSCKGSNSLVPVIPSEAKLGKTDATQAAKAMAKGGGLSWGIYNIEIARDGSFSHVVMVRAASFDWGYHLNVLKMLEVSPCSNCLSVGNVHKLTNGDLSVDISITHPLSNPEYTGFDVRGIVMFPASQPYPDNDLRAKAGLGPMIGAHLRYSSSKLGDAELMNPEGWTTIWCADPYDVNAGDFRLEPSDLPIFSYYKGKYASGSSIGILNAFRRFHSNENRHMFEVKKTVTQTYIIRPPASGSIEASYSIYAHWAPPIKTPVANPASDFGPEANSPMPYEFSITQDSVIDPDAPLDNQNVHLHWHMKMWNKDTFTWGMCQSDIMYHSTRSCWLQPHPSGDNDDYWVGEYALAKTLTEVPGALPGAWPFLFSVYSVDPKELYGLSNFGTDWYIFDVDLAAYDGKW